MIFNSSCSNETNVNILYMSKTYSIGTVLKNKIIIIIFYANNSLSTDISI
jgi:hypothetical protein